jgi:hypothetical protein
MKGEPWSTEAIVKQLDLILPSREDEAAGVLWDVFANRPDEQRFDALTSAGWEKKFEDFRDALVNQAMTVGLDSRGLLKAINSIRPGTQTVIGDASPACGTAYGLRCLPHSGTLVFRSPAG